MSDNVFGNLAEPVMGFPLSLALYLAVLASSAASLITTFLPTTRTLLGHGRLRRDAEAVRAHPPAVQVTEHGDDRRRHRGRRLLHRDDDPQRAGADRHDPVARAS